MRADGWVYRVILALSGITLVLVVVYLYLAQENRSDQAEVNQRQQFINQSIEFNRVNNALIQAIATAAVNDKDDKLRSLLAQNGITINPATGAPGPTGAVGPTAAPPAMNPSAPAGPGK
jgi:hypothetical protein